MYLSGRAFASTSDIEEAAEKGPEEGKVPTRYTNTDFEIGPDPGLGLSDCRSYYFIFPLTKK